MRTEATPSEGRRTPVEAPPCEEEPVRSRRDDTRRGGQWVAGGTGSKLPDVAVEVVVLERLGPDDHEAILGRRNIVKNRVLLQRDRAATPVAFRVENLQDETGPIDADDSEPLRPRREGRPEDAVSLGVVAELEGTAANERV